MLAAWRERRLARQARRRHRARFEGVQGAGVLHPRVLFVGTADLGRSPFAARAARAALEGCRVESAALEASGGGRCPEPLVRLAGELGIDLADHEATRLTRARLAAADIVLVMDLRDYARIAAEFPWAMPRTTLLGLFATPARLSIGDLTGADERDARRILAEIAAGVAGLAAWIRTP